MALCSQGQPVVRHRYGKSCVADKLFSQNNMIFLVLSGTGILVSNPLKTEEVNHLRTPRAAMNKTY